MIITFEVSGGYGGLFAKQPLLHRVDPDSLAEPGRSELLELVESSGIRTLNLPAETGRGPTGQTYRLSLEESGKTTTIRCNDVNAPASVRPLLGYLQRLAFEARAQGGAAPRA